MNNSQIFTAYNQVKNQADQDQARTNRALGYLLSKDTEDKLSKYNATTSHCDCPNNKYQGNCKHIRARKMQLSDRNNFTIQFYGQTYEPTKLLTASEIELPILVEAIINGHITVSVNQASLRIARKSNLEVIEALRENNYELAWVALVGNQNESSGWFGLYEMTFYLD